MTILVWWTGKLILVSISLNFFVVLFQLRGRIGCVIQTVWQTPSLKEPPRDSSVRYAASLTFYASFNDATKPPWFLSICFENTMGRLSSFKAELKLSRLQLTFTVPCNPDNRSQPSVAPNTIIKTSNCVFHSHFRCWKVLRAHAQILKKKQTNKERTTGA